MTDMAWWLFVALAVILWAGDKIDIVLLRRQIGYLKESVALSDEIAHILRQEVEWEKARADCWKEIATKCAPTQPTE
jgi:hypothetical protein